MTGPDHSLEFQIQRSPAAVAATSSIQRLMVRYRHPPRCSEVRSHEFLTATRQPTVCDAAARLIDSGRVQCGRVAVWPSGGVAV
jgi:hypothetical protein